MGLFDPDIFDAGIFDAASPTETGGALMPGYHFFCCQSAIEADVRTRVNNYFSSRADGDDDDVILGTPALYMVGTTQWSVFVHPCPDKWVTRIQSKVDSLPQTVRNKIQILDAIPANAVPVGVV